MAPPRAEGDVAAVKLQGNASTESLRARLTPLRDKSNTHANPRKSTNPFRQHQDLSKVSLMRSVSQGTENSSASGVRKNAPPRAVFHDLPTAHSSITSGTARSKCRDPSNNLSETLDDDDEKSVLLQDMELATRWNSFLDDLPLPPTPAVISNSRYDEPTADCLLAQDDEIISEQRGRLTPSVQPETRLQPGSMFTTIKNSLGTKSSPITVNDKSSTLTPKQRPKRMLHLNKTESYKGSTRHPTYKVPDASKFDPHTPQAKTKAIKLEEVIIGHSTDGYERDPSSIYRSSREEAQSSSLSLSSPKADDTIDRASHLEPFHLAPPKGFGSYYEAVRIEDLASTPAGREQSLQLPPQMSDGRIQSNEISSLPDGSTVGNIYKHYVGSLSDDDEQSDLGLPRPMGSAERSSGSGLRPSALLVRKQRRAERAMSNLQVQPPQSSLPSAPSLAAQRTIPSSSQGLGHSSSYGDTYNLLDITQREHWTGLRPAMTRSDANNNLRSDHASPEWGDSSLRTPFTSNNPFLGNLTPQVIISQPTDGEVIYDDAQSYTLTDRQPLEREVSNALRRASGISIYSNGSISSSILRYADYRSDLPSSDSIGCLRRLQLEDTPVSDSGSVDGGSRNGVDHVQAFYDQGAIAPNWINNHHNNNVIRIPINHNGLFPDSPPHSPRPTSTLPSKNQDRGKSREADDVNDWETIGDSALGGDIKVGNSSQILGMLGGTVGQAGSSIANTSDDGTASTYIPDIENYGSTERFIQHPGNTRYHGDYRRRDLKHTHTPVFLPEFREHKVNGYLADSNRTRPPVTLFNQSPHPLESDHVHPFKSPPPERMPVQKAKASPTPRKFLTPKPLSELNSLQTSETETIDDSSTDIIDPERRSIKPINETYNWMDDFGEPGPAIRPANLGLRPPSPQHRPSSYEHVMRIARGGAVSGYNPNGTAITGGSREITNDPKSHSKASIDGLDKSNPTRKMGDLRSPRTHQPLVQGPPGAFFRGILHSGSTSKYAPRSHGGDGAAKSSTRQSSTKNYPTNTLRPLSLLESRRASMLTTPTFDRKEPSQDTLPNDFVYRSPLAPPRRFSSQRLYSGSRLLEIKEAAKADGYEMRVLPTANSRTSSKDSRARKHIFEIPPLPWPREPSTRTDLCQEKKKLSISALCLCNLFPPLLLLYALGQLDGVVCWWTNGDISRFGKDQKRWAYILMACWGLTTILGLVSFLVYWFSFAG